MLGSPYYFGTSRKIVTAVGNLLNDVHIIRTDSEGTQVKDIKVPIAYAAKQHYLAKLRQEDLADGGTAVSSVLPRLSFMLAPIGLDSTRQRNALGYTYKKNTTDSDVFMKMFNPVPYNLDFEVIAYAKNMDDGLQIIEQIVPWFTPEFNLSINTVPELGISEDIPLVLNGVSLDDNAEMGFSDNRLISWTMSFTARAYFYKPIVDAKIIKSAIVEWKNPDNGEIIETQTNYVDPATAFVDDIYTVVETII